MPRILCLLVLSLSGCFDFFGLGELVYTSTDAPPPNAPGCMIGDVDVCGLRLDPAIETGEEVMIDTTLDKAPGCQTTAPDGPCVYYRASIHAPVLVVIGSRPLILVAEGDIIVDAIDVRPGVGERKCDEVAGENDKGGGAGGAGGSYAASGGNGGVGDQNMDSPGSVNGGVALAPVGLPIGPIAGCLGGPGGGDTISDGIFEKNRGLGGGAISILSRTAIDVAVAACGGGGNRGIGIVANIGGDAGGGGGGGGSGGLIRIEAQSVNVRTAYAVGGGGGEGGVSAMSAAMIAGNGGPGEAGCEVIDGAVVLRGLGGRGLANGGDGGDGGGRDLAPGEAGRGNNGGGGGGGGGAGYIQIVGESKNLGDIRPPPM